ncbi:concanavalin A-like lectin/glucanase domain-containing protein [Mycena metata]|uniref:Concanavalin A-like lectin/glucanase domain-containing protein n=1 Tax=Mycena metata TaxID=1033252 RepID=A0AAD7P219_9AGAR|nr:concanavalin A-like lectin/glucanase domain-containing protein [Mycena metata]
MAPFARLNVLVTLVALSATQILAQSCACGYKDSNGHVWREAINSTFTESAGALAAVKSNWDIATDLESDQPETAKASIQYVKANVVEHNNALGLKASAYDNSGSVKSAEISTKRDDILYGSFRMQAQVPTTPGVVFGFFTYISDSQEQDIEFLSADSDFKERVYYTNQPGQLANGDDDPKSTKNGAIPGADFTTFGVHRIDWLPASTTYSYAGTSDKSTPVTASSTITKNVPTTPSYFVLNVWSNGDPNFSKGPPTADAFATVNYVHLYFNSTSLSEASFNAACSAAHNVAPCNI